MGPHQFMKVLILVKFISESCFFSFWNFSPNGGFVLYYYAFSLFIVSIEVMIGTL